MSHLIDLQELRLREVLEMDRKFREQQAESERRFAEYEALGRQINDLACFATQIIRMQHLALLAVMFREDKPHG